MAQKRDLSGNSPAVDVDISHEEVLTAELTSTGDIVARGKSGRIHSVYFVDTATGGSVVLRDGGSSGAIITTIDTPSGAGSDVIPYPMNGLKFVDGVHATLTNVDGVTIAYSLDN